MTEVKRAQYVCFACKTRKKACDKALPACGFCTKYKLACRYDITPPKSSYITNRRNVGKNFVLLSPSPESDSQIEDETGSLLIPTIQSNPLSPHSTVETSLSIDELLNQQVSCILELANLSLDDITERYLKTFHKWLPVIAPALFRETTSKYGAGVPPADFSVLLLTMCLTTITPDQDTLRPPLSREFLYTTTKSLFTQTQAVVCTSLSLVQAAFLIAASEYVCARPKTAYVSLGTCTSMARVLGIGESPTPQDGIQVELSTRMKDLEKSNLSWAIVMLERMILCEIDRRDLRPLIAYPNPETRLPSDLRPAHLLEVKQPDLEPSKPATLSMWYAPGISRFGRQAQAVSLLDQVSCIVRSEAGKQSILSELRQLDSKIQSFLAMAIEEDEGKETITSVTIAITVRSLFLVHWGILEHVQICQTEADDQLRQSSWAALGTASQMVLQVAQFHMKHDLLNKVDTMPSCCRYNLRYAMQYLQDRDEHTSVEDLSQNIDCLLASERVFSKRWIL